MSQAPDITGTEGERLDATVTVDSTFSSQETQTIELRVEDGGTVVHTDSQQVTLADSTDSQQITLSWPTSGGDAGVYDLFIESDQDTIQRLVEVVVEPLPSSAIHRWKLNDVGTGTATDYIQSEDGAVNGVTSVSGTFQGGSAGEGDGTGEYIDVGTLGTFGSQLATNSAFAFTVETTTDTTASKVLGMFETGGNSPSIRIGLNESANLGSPGNSAIAFGIRDDDGDKHRVGTDGTLNDGAKHRVLWNVKDVTNNNSEIYVDGVQQSIDTNVDQSPSASQFSDFTRSVYLFAMNQKNNGGPTVGIDGIVDDVICYNDSLTAEEIADDYNLQPWV